MQLRVTRPADAVPEPGRHEPRTGQAAGAPRLHRHRLRGPVVAATPHMARLAFQPTQRARDCRLPGLNDIVLHAGVAQRPQHRHRLRDRERQIEPRHPPPVRAQPLTVRRQPGPGP
jgi:hypothetical protein